MILMILMLICSGNGNVDYYFDNEELFSRSFPLKNIHVNELVYA